MQELEVSKKEMDDLGVFASILGHIGDGNFHESILYNKKDPKEYEAVKNCVYRMVDRALEMDGTCTGEVGSAFLPDKHQTNLFQHSIGLGKKASLLKELGPETVGVMKSIKRALDPHWLMNPGKIMDH